MQVFRFLVALALSTVTLGFLKSHNTRRNLLHSKHIAFSTSKLNAGDYAKLTVPSLKDILRERGLPVGGVKAVLIGRIEASEEQEVIVDLDLSASVEGTKTIAWGGADEIAKSAPASASDSLGSSKKVHVERGASSSSSFSIDHDLEALMMEGDDIMKNSPSFGFLNERSSSRGEDIGNMNSNGELRKPRHKDRAPSERDIAIEALEQRSEQRGRSDTNQNHDERGQGDTKQKGSHSGEDNFDMIQELVDKRSEYRKVRDFDAADSVRDDLKLTWGVEIYDSDGKWECTNLGYVGPLNVHGSLQMKAPATAAVKCTMSEGQIQDLVNERTHCRRSREFGRADEIRDMLASGGVELYDKQNEWASFDGEMSGLQSTDRYSSYSPFKSNENVGFYASDSVPDGHDGEGESWEWAIDEVKVVDDEGNESFKQRKFKRMIE